MQLENVIKRLLKFLRNRLDNLSMSVTSGGVDNMENYQVYNRTDKCLRGNTTGNL